MPVEMIGWIAPRVSSEIIPAHGPAFDSATVAETARIHERAGFDRVLIGYYSDAPDGFLVGACAAGVTERLGFLLAHRPGFVAPPLAARKLATLDQLCAGRLAVHIISGGSDADQAKDGDWADHAARYRRSAEYVGLLRRVWTEPAPFDHEGEFYKTRGTYSNIRCHQQPHIPIYGGGGSEQAIQSLAPHLDVFMLWGEPLKETAAFMARVRGAAAAAGRRVTFSLSTRPILAATDAKAWERARAILDKVLANRAGTATPQRQNVGSQRLLQAAAASAVHDTCLWTPLAAATGAQGNSTALVGSPETVARALLEYYKLGATTLLIRGYDPRPDAVQYGEELIPRLRELVAHYDAE
ncbi:MAG: LLM class flavin-dependent oxidoreductase [Alphaproteobacteria bacterium]|nr:LLM class flavin-dependent oxidoreductase [Alphaproteobacteria bacterium]